MPFLGMSFGNSDNNNNSSNNNNNSILDVLYHNTMQQKKLKQEQDEQKNSLLNQMEGYVEPKDVLYSSVDDLKKMRDDLLSKNLIKPSLPLPANTANTTNPNNNQPQPQPQNPLQSIQNSSDTQVPTPALLPKINPKDRAVETFSQKPALLPKIDPGQKEELKPQIEDQREEFQKDESLEKSESEFIKKPEFKFNNQFVSNNEQKLDKNQPKTHKFDDSLNDSAKSNENLKATIAKVEDENYFANYNPKDYTKAIEERRAQALDRISQQNEDVKRRKLEWDVKLKNIQINMANFHFFNKGASLYFGPDAANMLNLSKRRFNILYTKDALKVNSCFDREVSDYNNGELNQFVPYIYQKIQKQFLPFGYDAKKVDGYIFKSNSAPVKRIKQSQDFKNILAKNIDNIQEGQIFNARFSNPGWRGSNLYNAFGSVDFLCAGYDKKGNLRLYMFDTYDFNRGENAKVEAARRQMMQGKLKGYYTIHEILISPSELDSILRSINKE